jgi:hypothetical protein
VFKKLRAFGFNNGLIEDLVDKGVEIIVIYYKKYKNVAWVNEHIYLVRPWTVITKGILYKAEDFESQLMIPISLLDEYKKDEVKL